MTTLTTRRLAIVAALLAALQGGSALAAVTADEAKQLGSTLTELGAIRQGNAEGTIPAYTGGIAAPPPGYAPVWGAARGGAPYVDPYAADKPLFSITAKNMAQYADRIDEASKVLLQRFPDSYRMDVYPTHRSASLPKFALENTVKNVMKPRLMGGGLGVADAHAQVPFPIPKTGHEALWNYQLRYYPPWEIGGAPIFLVDAAGNTTKLSDDPVVWEHGYWDPARSSVEHFERLITEQGYPASRAGAKTLAKFPLRWDEKDFVAWAYIPGQRRVRLAPEVKYDVPMSSFGGLLFSDEAGSLTGRMDRFDYRLVGRKEMFVPYNAYRFAQTPVEAGTMKSHHDPDVLRFELHRVWIVEGTLKAGERHANSKKVWLIDEDSWVVTTYYSYDQAMKPFRLMLNGVFNAYDLPAMRSEPLIVYDLIKGGYLYSATFSNPRTSFRLMEPPANPDAFFSPDALAGGGVR